jgi:transglutaminase superfamily protein
MSTTTGERDSELAQLEHEALARIAAEEGRLETELERAGAGPDAPEPLEPEPSAARFALAVLFTTVAAGVMVGGIYQGASPRLYAIAGGILGVALAFGAARLRKPLALNVVVLVGLFVVGLVVVLPTGAGNIVNVRSLAQSAADSSHVLRPPVPFTPGWAAIIGWLMGIVGFAGVWLAVVIRRPALGVIIPLPVAAIAGISVPHEQQVGSGLAVLGLFAIALGILSSAQQLGGDGETRLPISYELRKAFKSLAVLVPVLLALYALAQSDVLFPRPVIDPVTRPQKPHTTPLSEVPDRVLFSVQTKQPQIPFRTGSLDVYDGKDWLLAPFGSNRLKSIPKDGVVNRTLQPGTTATFTVAGLTGAVVPTLPNIVGIVAEGPKLVYDARSDNVRVAQGQVQAGLSYSIAAEALPTVQDLQKVASPNPPETRSFLDIPAPPPAVVDLLAKAPKTSRWDTWDQLRTYVLQTVVASGPGQPVDITPSRVQAILANPKAGATPYEIVAVQALLARWVGIPSRIGYGFAIDRQAPEIVDGRYQLRPKDGAVFPEVYFPGFGWLPVIGTPRQAKPTVSSSNLQQVNNQIQPSNDIAVQVFLPVLVPPGSVFVDQLRRALLIALPLLGLLGLLYVLYPAVRKALLRSRRRRAALASGPRARIALAYAEWRDFATDFGFGYPTDTPLMFLDRFVGDDEHAELAWLTTRALWGDLQVTMTDEDAVAAEELSRALRRRLASAQPASLRAVAVVSRLSLRAPYAAETELGVRSRREEVRDAQPVGV